MKQFLEEVNYKIRPIIEYIKAILTTYYNLILLVIGLVSYVLFSRADIFFICSMLFLLIIINKRNNIYIMSKKIERFDGDTPKLLGTLINDCILENFVYKYGKIQNPYIKPKDEIQMNYDVIDLITLRLSDSVLMDKFRLYYGNNFEEILAFQVNMNVTIFVINENSKEPKTKKYKPGSTGLISSERSTEDSLKSFGIKIIK